MKASISVSPPRRFRIAACAGALALLAAVIADSTPGLAAQGPEIDRASVEHVIRVLAADDMEGRGAFTPAAWRAAAFIAGQFAEIGLEQVEGAPGYLQRFPVYSMSTDTCRVTLNGSPVAADHARCRVGAGSIDWSTGDDLRLLTLGPDDDARQVFNQAMRGGPDTLLLVDSSQAAFFEQASGFFGRGSRSVEPPGDAGGPSAVMVLTDATDVTSFSVHATAKVEEQPLTNVVGRISGNRADQIVLFSGHYDHIGIRPPGPDGDTIANGANDDASGTTAVIELARAFKKMGKPERTLLFAAFTAEEAGGYGSRYFSQQLDPDQIVAMFNIEMIGKPAVSGPNTAWITGFERSSFGSILQNAVEGTGYEFYPDPYPTQNLFYRSDNATLARLGVPAHSISTTPIDVDPDYHQVSDEVETLDLDHMANTIQAIALGAATIISGEATPTRVDPQTVRGGR